ncbi:hypothetical protein MY8738_009701 [Beauveria namnaoensis]
MIRFELPGINFQDPLMPNDADNGLRNVPGGYKRSLYVADSKWNAANAYIGEISSKSRRRTGYQPRPKTFVSCAKRGQCKNALYGKLWKCLFVLDSLVAALLGRKPQAAAAAGTDCSPLSPNGRDDCLAFNVASANMIRRTFNIIYNQRQFPAERASTMLEQAQLYTPVSFQGQDSADTLATQLAILFRYYAFTLLTRPSSSGNFTSRPSRSTTGRGRTCLLRASSPRTSPSCAYTRYSVTPQSFETTICGAILVILTNQFFDFYKYPGSGNVVKQAFAILELWNAQNPKEEGELSSLYSLRRFVDEQMPRRLPGIGGGGGRPVYVDMSPCGGEAVGYDVPSDGRTGAGVFQEFEAEFAALDYTALLGAL